MAKKKMNESFSNYRWLSPHYNLSHLFFAQSFFFSSCLVSIPRILSWFGRNLFSFGRNQIVIYLYGYFTESFVPRIETIFFFSQWLFSLCSIFALDFGFRVSVCVCVCMCVYDSIKNDPPRTAKLFSVWNFQTLNEYRNDSGVDDDNWKQKKMIRSENQWE